MFASADVTIITPFLIILPSDVSVVALCAVFACFYVTYIAEFCRESLIAVSPDVPSITFLAFKGPRAEVMNITFPRVTEWSPVSSGPFSDSTTRLGAEDLCKEERRPHLAVGDPVLKIERSTSRAIPTKRKSGMAHETITAATGSPFLPGTRVYIKAVICLLMGLTAGYLFRGSRLPASPRPTSANAGAGKPSIAGAPMSGGRAHSLGDMKQMADAQAAPLLEKLKSDPNNSALLGQLGSIYHTTHQFQQAAAYYDKAVQVDPRNVPLRTKLASSLYRSGDADGALKELNQALRFDPNDANALFDLGVIKLHEKQDGKGALAAWRQLLRANPQLSAERKATVQKLIVAVVTMLSDQKGIQEARSSDGRTPNVN
jgi:cytochrome c-type biogenesis protein CcmH/NrfG